VQRGTGDAASVALTAFPNDDDSDDEDIVVLPGDTPLVRPSTLGTLVHAHREANAAATLLTARMPDVSGMGRVVRTKDGRVSRIVEELDATEAELEIDEVGTSIYCFRRSLLAPALRRLSPENAQGEYYLTDVIGVLRQAGHRVEAVEAPETAEALGVNDPLQLAQAERALRERINARWMVEGVKMLDPEQVYLDSTVTLAPEVRVLPGTILEGRTVVGARSVIGPNTRLTDCVVGEDVTIACSVAADVEIADRAVVGPFSHLRAGSRIGAGAKVGSFVETKNAEIGEGAKVPHLAYVGDAEVGPDANIGAGTITANFDGRSKHRTVIGPGASTGSNTVLVAPVSLGEGAVTAAGAVVVEDVPPGALAKGVPAKNEPGWVSKRDESSGGPKKGA
ncbi:MAG: bifunctional UDP-N-acetylglucosamine diphosphorylase/glucosamine-1-phosphate N-acetyltransferase GlmU, partial [Acidimicrobiia bacterium]